MQKFKVTDNANPDGTAKNREGVVSGTSIMSDFLNDNFFNLFEFLTSQGYTLIDGDTSQFAKANKSLYNATYTYNTSGIATQTVSDIVEGSDGYYYQVLLDNIINDDPVGSVTGAWKRVVYDKSTNINQLTSVASLENLSEFAIADSTDNFNLKKINWFAIKAAMKQYLNYSYVPIAGNSTISGIKTFSESPTAPTPTTGGQVTNKDYVDNLTDINALTAKTTPIDADEFVGADSADTFALKKFTFANLKATLKTYFDTLYSRTSNIFGIGQAWQDVLGSRAAGITYTNTTGKPIKVSLTYLSTNTQAYTTITVDTEEVYWTQALASGSYNYTLIALVPAGEDYILTLGSGTLTRWKEFR